MLIASPAAAGNASYAATMLNKLRQPPPAMVAAFMMTANLLPVPGAGEAEVESRLQGNLKVKSLQ